MGVSYYNPYWAKAIQNQQKAQNKPQGKPDVKQQQQPGKPRDFGGFDSLIVGRECVIKLGTGEAVKGVVSAASKFWYLVNVGGQVIVINKAWVVSVMPAQTTSTNNNTNNTGGSEGNGRDQTSRQK
jgi:hypothetical protein